jgi:hypothetical protein
MYYVHVRYTLGTQHHRKHWLAIDMEFDLCIRYASDTR